MLSSQAVEARTKGHHALSDEGHTQAQHKHSRKVRVPRGISEVSFSSGSSESETPLMKGAVQSNSNQGQSTSTAYDHDFAAVSVDVTFGADQPLTPSNDTGLPLKTNTSRPKHATHSGQNVKGVGSDVLHKAIAADALRKKLKEEEKKRMSLEDLAKQDPSNDESDVVIDMLTASKTK